MTNSRFAIAASLALACAPPLSVQAHRAWMLPSSTIVSGSGAWVTVDAAVSNDLFYFDHQPLRLESLLVLAPDGTPLKADNISTGRYRSTFDVRLTQQGTYKIGRVSDTAVASYDEHGQLKHFQGAWADLAKAVPVDAPARAVQRTTTRLEIFVTAGKPTDTVLAPTGAGLELVPVTHPNDLVDGEAATFGLLLDGRPAPNLGVEVIPGGIRYRDQPNERRYTTDGNGRFTITFDEPGMYWMHATYQDGDAGRRQASPSAGARGRGNGQAPPLAGRPGGAGGRGGRGRVLEGPVQPGRRASYTATLEVLPQ